MCLLSTGTITHSVPERTNVTLKCPLGVGGSDYPTWSKETAGNQQDIRSNVSTVNKTRRLLTITGVKLVDSGLYYCDGKQAVYLNVTKGERQQMKNTTNSLMKEKNDAAA